MTDFDPALHNYNSELRKRLGGVIKLRCFRGAVAAGYYSDWPEEVDREYLMSVRPDDEGTNAESETD